VNHEMEDSKMLREFSKKLGTNLPVSVCLHHYLLDGDHRLAGVEKIVDDLIFSVHKRPKAGGYGKDARFPF